MGISQGALLGSSVFGFLKDNSVSIIVFCERVHIPALCGKKGGGEGAKSRKISGEKGIIGDF
jgi:hypothetical protein